MQDGRLVIADGDVMLKLHEGHVARHGDEVQAIGTEVGQRLAATGQKVQMVISYDHFYLDPALAVSIS